MKVENRNSNLMVTQLRDVTVGFSVETTNVKSVPT